MNQPKHTKPKRLTQKWLYKRPATSKPFGEVKCSSTRMTGHPKKHEQTLGLFLDFSKDDLHSLQYDKQSTITNQVTINESNVEQVMYQLKAISFYIYIYCLLQRRQLW